MTRNRNERDAQAAASPFVYSKQAKQAAPQIARDATKQGMQPIISELPHVISLPLLLQQPLAEPGWIVPGLLPVGVSLLAGPTRVDKALLANQLGLSVATGTPFLRKFPTRQGHVLYLALAESHIHMRGRAVNLLNDQHSADAFHVAFQWSPFRQGGLADLEDTIAGLEEPRLIIVDPLEFVQPLRSDTGNYGYRVRQAAASEVALTFFVPLRELATRYDLAILLLHHLSDDWPNNRRDPLAGLSPTGLTAASACNLLAQSPRNDIHACELHLAGTSMSRSVACTWLMIVRKRGEWKEE